MSAKHRAWSAWTGWRGLPLLFWQPRCPSASHRIQVQEQLAHDRNQDDLAHFASLPQGLIEVLMDAFLPNHGQRHHVQRVVARCGLCPGPDIWLLLRRHSATDELKCHLCNGPADLPTDRLVWLAALH